MGKQVNLHSKSALCMDIGLGRKTWKLAMNAGEEIREGNVSDGSEAGLQR